MTEWRISHVFLLYSLVATWWCGCGALNINVTVSFNMNGVSGVINFTRSSSYGNLTMITVSLSGLDQYPSESFPWHIHNYPLTTTQRDPCSAASVGGHFDPFMVGGGVNYSTLCSNSRSLCEVGDLSGKHGRLSSTMGPARFFVDSYLPLYGVHSILGRSIVIHRENGARWVCANIGYPSDVMVAYSPFRTVLAGSIFFIEPYSPINLTTVFVRLSYISGPVNSNSHNWHVHRDSIGGDDDCDDGGPHYNPRRIDVDSPDYSYCSPSNQTACEIGDLTGKGSRLDFINGQSFSFYSDTELPVRVNGLNETILNRSVVVHSSGAGAPRIACANLIEYTPRVAVARFEEDGVTGQIRFKQTSPFSPTTVRVELSGLASRADGYHVHEFPVDESIQGSSKCTDAGGHFNPRNIVRNSSSLMTLDAYEIGDLSGKFGGLINDSIASIYSDPYLPLFGTENIVGRSVVIHHPNGDRWLCANIVYDMKTISITTNITSNDLQGRLVFTQLANDPFSETTIFLDFNIGPPVMASSSTSRVMVTSTPTQSSSSMVVTSVSSPSSSVMPPLISTPANLSVTSSSFTSLIPSVSSASSSLSSSYNSTSMLMVTSTISTSSQVTTSVALPSPSSAITPTTSTLTDDKMSADDKPPPASLSLTLDFGSGLLPTSLTPSASPDDKPEGRRKKGVFRRQAANIYLSVQNGCESGTPSSNPSTAPPSCSPDNQLACPIGDLLGKHGALSPGRNLLTDLNLPLTGPKSIAGMAVAVRVGNANSPVIGCLSLPSSVLPSSVLPSSVLPTGTREEASDDNKTVIIIASAVGGAVLLCLVLLLAICCCVWRRRKRTWKADFVTTNQSADHKSTDIELGNATYRQNKPTTKAEQYIVLYDYKPQSNDDLELREGDIIVFLERGKDGEWYRGQVGEKTGWFPAKYVRRLSESEQKKTMKEGDMNKAAAAILAANYNITRSGTDTISESDVSKLRRTRSEVTGAAKPPAPKVSPKNRERKLTHTGAVQQKDIDSTPRSVKKLELVKEGDKDVMMFKNQTAGDVLVGGATNSELVDVKQVETTEHPISPRSGDEIWIAEYNLESDSEDELLLKKGELIYVVEKSVSGWWKGRCDDGRAGWLPASYLRTPTSQEVQEQKKKQIVSFLEKKKATEPNSDLTITSSPTLTPKLTEREAPIGDVASQNNEQSSTEGGIEYVAKYAYEGRNENDLRFWPGDVIKVLWAEESGWWHGELENKQGWFPGSYVEPREGVFAEPPDEVEMEILLDEEAEDDDDEFSSEEVEVDEINEQVTSPLDTKKQSTGSLGFSQELSSILASKMSTLNDNEVENISRRDEVKETGKSQQRRKPPPPPAKPKLNIDRTDAMAGTLVSQDEVAVTVDSEVVGAQFDVNNTTTQSADKPRPPTTRRRPPPAPKPKVSITSAPDETDSAAIKPAESSTEGASQTTDFDVSKPNVTSIESTSQAAVQASEPPKHRRKQRAQKTQPVLPKRTVKSVLVVPRGGLQRERPPTPSPSKPIPPPPSKPCPPRPTVAKAAYPPAVKEKEDVEAAAVKPASPSLESNEPAMSSDQVDAADAVTKPKPPLKPKPKLLPKPKVLPKPQVLPKPKVDANASQVESKESKPVISPRLKPSEFTKKDTQEPIPTPRKKKPGVPQRVTSLSSPDNKITEARDSPDGAEDIRNDKKTVGTSSHPKRPPPRPPVSKKLMERQESLKKIIFTGPAAEGAKKDIVTSQPRAEPKVLFDASQQPPEQNSNPQQEQGRSSFFKSLKKMVQKSDNSTISNSQNKTETSVASSDKPLTEDTLVPKDSSRRGEEAPLVTKKRPEKSTESKEEAPVPRKRSLTTPTKPTTDVDSTDGGGIIRPPKPTKPVPQLPALKSISEILETSLNEIENKTDKVSTDRPEVPKRRKKSKSPEVEPLPSSPLKSPATKPKPDRPPPPKFTSPNDSEKIPTRAYTVSSTSDVKQEPRIKLRRAKFSYIAKKTGELSFNKGDVLTEMEPKNKNGMCYGMLDNGTSGFYQAKFVEPFTPT